VYHLYHRPFDDFPSRQRTEIRRSIQNCVGCLLNNLKYSLILRINSVVYGIFKNGTWNQMHTWTPEMYSNINHFCSIWPLNKYEFRQISDPVQSISFNFENDVVIETLSCNRKVKSPNDLQFICRYLSFRLQIPHFNRITFFSIFGGVMTNMFLLNYVMYFNLYKPCTIFRFMAGDRHVDGDKALLDFHMIICQHVDIEYRRRPAQVVLMIMKKTIKVI